MNQLIVALDVDTTEEAVSLADQLRGTVGGFKIGSRLFTSRGPSCMRELVDRGDRVFLDLKFHDIPNTVAGAVAAATRLGVWIVDVHAAGGAAMMRAAKEAALEEASRVSGSAPLVVAITVLTSFNRETLAAVGVTAPIDAQVGRLASLSQEAGLDGVVASPHEIGLIRQACGPEFMIVTPGIRSATEAKGDQSRTMSAAQAMMAGASFLVVGRPIIAAADPRAAAERIALECGPALPQ
jgi:orotidine-5'-phosphate decarboxylase